jgi:aminomethyltransferase
MNETLKRTELYEEHIAAGGRMVPFAGWEMPVQYSGVIPEVRAVREGCGVFDVSHMGHIWLEHPVEVINNIVSADWSKIPPGRAAYSLLLDESGAVLDDIMGYHFCDNQWGIVVNASRRERVMAHLKNVVEEVIPGELKFDQHAILAVQGPDAEKIMQIFCDDDLSQMQWRDTRHTKFYNVDCSVARGGYTGCDGFEIFFEDDNSVQIWRALLRAGAVPCGLGARDVLRLEAGLPLYGHELREEWTPAESGVGFAAKLEKPNFIGREALAAKPTPENRIRALKMEGKGIPREGYPVMKDGVEVGFVTSGTMSPTIGAGIALARVPHALQIGDTVAVQIRGTAHAAQIVKPPFVAHQKRVSG